MVHRNAIALAVALLALVAGCGGSDGITPIGPETTTLQTTAIDTTTQPVPVPTTTTEPVPVPTTTTEPVPVPTTTEAEPSPDAAAFRAEADAICNQTLMQGFALRTQGGGAPTTQVIDLFWNDQERQLPYWYEALDRMAALSAPAELSASWTDYVAAGRDLADMISAGLGQVRAGADPVAVFQQILAPMIGQIRRAQARAMEAGLIECFKLYYGGRLSGGEPTTPDDGGEPPPDDEG